MPPTRARWKSTWRRSLTHLLVSASSKPLLPETLLPETLLPETLESEMWRSEIRGQSRLASLFHLTKTVVSAAKLLVVVKLLLVLRGYAAAHKYASQNIQACRERNKRRWTFDSSLEPNEIARIVRGVARVDPKRFNCLPKALTLFTLLHRAGYPAVLRIGALPRGAMGLIGFNAHAWIELDGAPLGEGASINRYVVLPHEEANSLSSTATSSSAATSSSSAATSSSSTATSSTATSLLTSVR
jgi:hypothetical protein